MTLPAPPATPAPDADREREIARLEELADEWALDARKLCAQAKEYDAIGAKCAAEAAKLKEQRP